jgi:hypothetical protein
MLHFSKQTTWGTSANRVININNTGTGGDINVAHNMGSITWYSGNSTPTAEIAAYRNTPASGDNVELRFYTANAGTPNERMRIASTGALKLNSYGSGTFTGTAAYTLAVDSSGNIIETTGGGGSGTVNSGTSGYLAYYPSTGTTIDDTSGVYWDSSNSRLGIGTTSPGEKLEVNGNIIAGTNSSIYQSIRLGGGNAAGGRLFFEYNGDSSYIDCYGGHGGTERYRDLSIIARNLILQNSAGNVGIGTNNPQSKLHVYTDADVWHARIGGASGELRIGGQTTSGAVIQAYTPGGSVRDLYLQRDGGNVGIGTTGPSSKLHISTTSSNPFRMVRTGGAGTNFGFELGGGAIGLYDYTNSAYNWYITSTGDVGIGTTSPSAKLEINDASASSTKPTILL